MTPSPGNEPPGWVVWSTRASIDAGTPSLTAIVETLIAVPLYWWLAIHFETYLPLLVSACVAPLVLLRSDASVALGVKLFRAWEKRDNSRAITWTAVILWATGAGVLGYIAAKTFIAGQEAWPDFWRGAVAVYAAVALAGAPAFAVAVALAGTGGIVGGRLGAVMVAVTAAGTAAGTVGVGVGVGVGVAAWGAAAAAGALVGAVAAAKAGIRAFKQPAKSLLIPAAFGVAFGVFLASVVVRIFATLRFPGAGLKALPDNFRRLVFCTSPLQIPELVPGVAEHDTEFTFASQLLHFKNGLKSHKLVAVFAFVPAIVVWFGPAWCYRFILKSTAWFWWPLAFLGGEARLAKTPAKFHRKTWRTLWAKTNFALAVATLASFCLANFVLTGAVFEKNPLLTVLGYFLVVDWSPRSWQLFVAALAALSLAIVYLVDIANGDYREAIETNNRIELARAERNLVLIERIARLRFIFALTFWILVGGQTILYFNSSACWMPVPANVQAWAEFFYGQRTPSPPTCSVHAGRGIANS